MSKALAVKEQQQLEIQPEAIPQPANMLAAIMQATQDPSIDADKLERLMNIGLRLEERQAERAFTDAMARLQPKLPRVAKRGAILKNDGTVMSKFARFEDIDAAVRPLLAEEGFSLNYGMMPPSDGKVIVTCTIRHSAGHSITNPLALPSDGVNAARTAVQAIGSSISYARRYLMCLMLNIVLEGEDTDGNNPEPITAEDVMKLEDMLEASGANRAKFLQYFKISKLSELPKGLLQQATNSLKQRIAERGK